MKINIEVLGENGKDGYILDVFTKEHPFKKIFKTNNELLNFLKLIFKTIKGV